MYLHMRYICVCIQLIFILNVIKAKTKTSKRKQLLNQYDLTTSVRLEGKNRSNDIRSHWFFLLLCLSDKNQILKMSHHIFDHVSEKKNTQKHQRKPIIMWVQEYSFTNTYIQMYVRHYAHILINNQLECSINNDPNS